MVSFYKSAATEGANDSSKNLMWCELIIVSAQDWSLTRVLMSGSDLMAQE